MRLRIAHGTILNLDCATAPYASVMRTEYAQSTSRKYGPLTHSKGCTHNGQDNRADHRVDQGDRGESLTAERQVARGPERDRSDGQRSQGRQCQHPARDSRHGVRCRNGRRSHHRSGGAHRARTTEHRAERSGLCGQPPQGDPSQGRSQGDRTGSRTGDGTGPLGRSERVLGNVLGTLSAIPSADLGLYHPQGDKMHRGGRTTTASQRLLRNGEGTVPATGGRDYRTGTLPPRAVLTLTLQQTLIRAATPSRLRHNANCNCYDCWVN